MDEKDGSLEFAALWYSQEVVVAMAVQNGILVRDAWIRDGINRPDAALRPELCLLDHCQDGY